MKTPASGLDVLRNPTLNKDAAFTTEERAKLNLHGLLPDAILSMEQQVVMEMEHLRAKSEPLEQYIGLIALLNRNTRLFHRVLVDHIEQLAPIVYTPTVGLACQRYSHILRRPRGLYLTPRDRGQIEECLRNANATMTRLIVVTDNERILGLGDQGVGGMGIPLGKLMLYTAGAGIHPAYTLPICLDVGTDNAALLDDPFYLGWRGRRLRGPDYESFVEEFVQAVQKVCPKAILQWEDFKKANAFDLLHRYQNRLPSFNDDIQGTAAVALGGVLAGVERSGIPLTGHRFLHLGAGAAGAGIGCLIHMALLQAGLSNDQARQRQVFLDSTGLVTTLRTGLDEHKLSVALTPEDLQVLGLTNLPANDPVAIAKAFRPTGLVGTSAQPGAFTEALLRAVGDASPHPMIFPLSNPTTKAECTASEAIRFTDGRALVATGSPFAPVVHNGVTHQIGQGNNVFIFPGLGLGALAAESQRISETMFLEAARTLAKFTIAHVSDPTLLYPGLRDLRTLSKLIAIAVARVSREEKLGPNLSDEILQTRINEMFWEPAYDEWPAS